MKKIIYFCCVCCFLFFLFTIYIKHKYQDNSNILELAKAEIESYCLRKNLHYENFSCPRVYSDNVNDFCIEYTTSANSFPRHIVLIFFKNGKISEVNSCIDTQEEIIASRKSWIVSSSTNLFLRTNNSMATDIQIPRGTLLYRLDANDISIPLSEHDLWYKIYIKLSPKTISALGF